MAATESSPTAVASAEQACLNAVPRLPDDQARAWVGFLATHAELTRALDAGLAAEFGLSLSALEVLARLAWESEGRLRMSDLAQGALLSQSRVSRLVDSLETRRLVARTSCPSDSRVVYALITPAGTELISRALEWHWAQVQERFFSPLSDAQVRELGAIWERMRGASVAGADAASCPGV